MPCSMLRMPARTALTIPSVASAQNGALTGKVVDRTFNAGAKIGNDNALGRLLRRQPELVQLVFGRSKCREIASRGVHHAVVGVRIASPRQQADRAVLAAITVFETEVPAALQGQVHFLLCAGSIFVNHEVEKRPGQQFVLRITQHFGERRVYRLEATVRADDAHHVKRQPEKSAELLPLQLCLLALGNV